MIRAISPAAWTILLLVWLLQSAQPVVAADGDAAWTQAVAKLHASLAAGWQQSYFAFLPLAAVELAVAKDKGKPAEDAAWERVAGALTTWAARPNMPPEATAAAWRDLLRSAPPEIMARHGGRRQPGQQVLERLAKAEPARWAELIGDAASLMPTKAALLASERIEPATAERIVADAWVGLWRGLVSLAIERKADAVTMKPLIELMVRGPLTDIRTEPALVAPLLEVLIAKPSDDLVATAMAGTLARSFPVKEATLLIVLERARTVADWERRWPEMVYGLMERIQDSARIDDLVSAIVARPADTWRGPQLGLLGRVKLSAALRQRVLAQAIAQIDEIPEDPEEGSPFSALMPIFLQRSDDYAGLLDDALVAKLAGIATGDQRTRAVAALRLLMIAGDAQKTAHLDGVLATLVGKPATGDVPSGWGGFHALMPGLTGPGALTDGQWVLMRSAAAFPAPGKPDPLASVIRAAAFSALWRRGVSIKELCAALIPGNRTWSECLFSSAWMPRYADGLMSAGFVGDEEQAPALTDTTAALGWWRRHPAWPQGAELVRRIIAVGHDSPLASALVETLADLGEAGRALKGDVALHAWLQGWEKDAFNPTPGREMAPWRFVQSEPRRPALGALATAIWNITGDRERCLTLVARVRAMWPDAVNWDRGVELAVRIDPTGPVVTAYRAAVLRLPEAERALPAWLLAARTGGDPGAFPVLAWQRVLGHPDAPNLCAIALPAAAGRLAPGVLRQPRLIAFIDDVPGLATAEFLIGLLDGWDWKNRAVPKP